MLPFWRNRRQAPNSCGDTPLHMAAFHGQEWAIDALIRLGADCHATNDKGECPFQVARQNTIRSKLNPPGERVAASAGDIGAEGGEGRPWDDYSDKVTALLRPSIRQEYNSRCGERSIDVQRRVSHRRFGQQSEGRISGAELPCADSGQEGGRLISKRRHGSAQSSASERSNGGIADDQGPVWLVNDSLVSSLISTETEEEGSYPFHERRRDELSFEEGSSEGELSQDGEGGTRLRY